MSTILRSGRSLPTPPSSGNQPPSSRSDGGGTGTVPTGTEPTPNPNSNPNLIVELGHTLLETIMKLTNKQI